MIFTHANLNIYTADFGEEVINLAKLHDYDLIIYCLGLSDITDHKS